MPVLQRSERPPSRAQLFTYRVVHIGMAGVGLSVICLGAAFYFFARDEAASTRRVLAGASGLILLFSMVVIAAALVIGFAAFIQRSISRMRSPRV
jgi:hypothetical protein